MEEVKTIGQQIYAYRKEHRLTPEDLAAKIGVGSDSSVSKWEISENIPREGTLKLLCEAGIIVIDDNIRAQSMAIMRQKAVLRATKDPNKPKRKYGYKKAPDIVVREVLARVEAILDLGRTPLTRDEYKDKSTSIVYDIIAIAKQGDN